MLRYSIDITQKNATLGEELVHVGNYLELLKARYGDRFSYCIDCDEALHGLLLPRVSLQPLAENCVQHGYRNKTGAMRIDILCRRTQAGTSITIRDNGDGFPDEIIHAVEKAAEQFRDSRYDSLPTDIQAQRVGLMNVLARMMYLSKRRMDVRILNDGGAVIELIFPDDAKEVCENGYDLQGSDPRTGDFFV